MTKRNTTRELTPTERRDMAFVAEANTWAKSMTHGYFEAHRTGLHTVADVLAWLDERDDIPHAWARWLGEYQTRYQMVRNVCISMAREGYLQTSSTQNAKGRDAVAYHYQGAVDGWSVAVAPTEQADRVNGLIRKWLHQHRDELTGVQTISITLRKSQTHEIDVAQGTPPGGGPVVRRRIA